MEWLKKHFTRSPYKIRDLNDQKYGVSVNSFSKLISLGCEKLKMNPDGVRVVLEEDGTLVDSDYFKTLPQQTVFVFLREEEKWLGVSNMIQNFFKMTADFEIDPHEILRSSVLEDLIKKQSSTVDDKTDLELRTEDEEWFSEIKRTFDSKSQYMNYKAQCRIKKYNSDAGTKLKKDMSQEVSQDIEKLMLQLKNKLDENSYHGSYFDRSASENQRICNSKGLFKCEGKFDQSSCEYSHSINPYSSRFNCLVFSLWDLDHIIEKTRVVIPTILKAAELKGPKQILDCDSIYNLLFTRENLKFVFRECHCKTSRVPTLNWETLCS
ncbi:DNA fragmentation factor subunit beta-like [Argonauta hians]